LPSEHQVVQVDAEDVVQEIKRRLGRLFNLAATKESTNVISFADVIVDGETLLEQVPVTYLLFLERELGNLRHIVADLPTLDPSVRWQQDGQGVWATEPYEQVRTRKVLKNHNIWVPPSPEYAQPAQVQTFTEDVIAGYWTVRRFSGALQPTRVRGILDKIDKVARAVRFARERANQTEVIDQRFGEDVLDYILA